MNLLLDTCAFIWAISQPDRLSQKAREALENEENALFVSAISGLEIATKRGIGRLELDGETADAIAQGLSEYGVVALPVSMSQAVMAGELPFHHKDPFDRVIIAQAKSESLVIVTPDAAFSRYAVPTLW
jgi:PIN domain nuclease of toxin-antitoxin system